MHYKDSTGCDVCGNRITENYLAVNEDHRELQGGSLHGSTYFPLYFLICEKTW